MNAASALGGVITNFYTKDAKSQDDPNGDVRDITFYTLVTDKGYVDIILHVDHNGYYGGSLMNPVECDEPPQSALPPEP